MRTLVFTLLVSCSQGGTPSGTSTDGAARFEDAASGSPDLASSSCNACAPDQICSMGQCTDLPLSCPCPADSYCDLAKNRCVAGCTMDAHCSPGRYCDGHACKAGCRGDADCPAPANGATGCVVHICELTCQAGYARCGGSCVADSPSSCGASCAVCAAPGHASATCDKGACGFRCDDGFLPDAGGCAAAVLCYADADGDGYRSATAQKSFVGAACPAKWLLPSAMIDCDDASADVHPGQGKYFSAAANGGDYDCSGTVEMRYSDPCCWQAPQGLCHACTYGIAPQCEGLTREVCADTVAVASPTCGPSFIKEYPCYWDVDTCRDPRIGGSDSVAIVCH